MKTSRQNREAALRLVYGDGPYGARATRWLEDGDDSDFESAWQGLIHRDQAEHLVDVAQAFAKEERRIKDKVAAYSAGDVLLIELCADLDLPRPPPDRRHRRESSLARKLKAALNAATNCGGPEHEAYYVLSDRVEAIIEELES